MSQDTTADHTVPAAEFWAPAFPRIQIWRTLLGFMLLHVVFFAATFGIFLLGAYLLGVEPYEILDGGSPAKAATFFLTFLGYHLGLWITLRLLHKRGFRSLFGPAQRVNWSHFRKGLVVAIGISLAAIAVQLLDPLIMEQNSAAEVRQAMPLRTWGLLIAPALVLVLVQICAEELVFRGYVLQQLRARFRSVWVWAILPSLAFGMLHFDPETYGINAVFYVIHTTVVGIVLALVTIRTGNIGAAAGLHFGNNAMLIFSGTEGNLDGFSLFLAEMDLKSSYMSWSIMTQTALVLIAFVGWWVLTQRKPPIANMAKAD